MGSGDAGVDRRTRRHGNEEPGGKCIARTGRVDDVVNGRNGMV
jgi:hypothetical protein